MWRSLSKTLVSICLLLLATATLFVSPGWRHSHQGGDESHSHSEPHSHSHGHSHGHHHNRGHVHTGNKSPGQPLDLNRSHIHISFLWFDLTLPDFFGAEATSFGSANPSPRGDSSPDAVRGELVEFQSPWNFSQLIQVLFLVDAPIPDRLSLDPDEFDARHVVWTDAMRGRLPDAPGTPPPEVS